MRELGDRAVLLPRPPGISARALVRAVRGWEGVIDCVVAQDEIGVYFAGKPRVDPRLLAALAAVEDDDPPAREHVLRAVYDGADLDDVARVVGLTVAQIVQLHGDATYIVETIGFAPGFAYLAGLDEQLAAIPRRATPRARVAAGALAIAGGYTAVYPFASPGGWNLIGHVDEPMFTADGARLALGDRVRFVR